MRATQECSVISSYSDVISPCLGYEWKTSQECGIRETDFFFFRFCLYFTLLHRGTNWLNIYNCFCYGWSTPAHFAESLRHNVTPCNSTWPQVQVWTWRNHFDERAARLSFINYLLLYNCETSTETRPHLLRSCNATFFEVPLKNGNIVSLPYRKCCSKNVHTCEIAVTLQQNAGRCAVFRKRERAVVSGVKKLGDS